MSLLRDLQEMATKSDVRVTSLLLKARILAARLDHEAFDKWIKSELDGYAEEVLRNGKFSCLGKGCHTVHEAREVIDPENESFLLYASR